MEDSAAAITDPIIGPDTRPRWRPRLAWIVSGLLCAAFLLYAETRAFVWDEGFHLVAAQMILAGKRPYLDFCFPQTPLNAYWNAGWMHVFGQSWRVTHIPAALEIDGTILLLTRYLLSRFQQFGVWRTPCVIAAILLFAANSILFAFAPIAQAYAICMFTGLGAFLFMVGAIDVRSPLRPFSSGLLAGIGAGSSLLIAALSPVLLIWLWLKNRSGDRRIKAIAFCAGVFIPFIPLVWLFTRSPRVVFFNILQYQVLFRRADWDGVGSHDFDVLTAWVQSGQLLLLLFFALAATVSSHPVRQWSSRLREEFWLAFWSSLALFVYISTAHPTFSRYYIVGMPLYAIVAAPGLKVVGSRLVSPARPFWPLALLSFVVLLQLGRALFDNRDSATWARYEEIAADIAHVTPPGAMLYADEQVYFLLHRLPPPGMEFSYSHKLDLPAKDAALFHVISAKELTRRIKAGEFVTVETCDDDKIDEWDATDLFKQKKEVSDCTIFWDFHKPPARK